MIPKEPTAGLVKPIGPLPRARRPSLIIVNIVPAKRAAADSPWARWNSPSSGSSKWGLKGGDENRSVTYDDDPKTETRC